MKIDTHRAEIRFSIHAISRLKRIDSDVDVAIDVVRNVLKTGKLVRKAEKNGSICTIIKRYKECDIVVEFAYRQNRIDVITVKVKKC